MGYPSNSVGTTAAKLRSTVSRVERLRETIKEMQGEVSAIYKDARNDGLDVPTIKALISERAKEEKDPQKFSEQNMLLELYRSHMGSGTENATRERARDTNSVPVAKASRDETDVPAGAASDGLASRESGGSGSVAPHSNPASSPPVTGDTAPALTPPVSPNPIEPLEPPVSEGSAGGAETERHSVTVPPEPDLPTFLDRRKHG